MKVIYIIILFLFSSVVFAQDDDSSEVAKNDSAGILAVKGKKRYQWIYYYKNGKIHSTHYYSRLHRYRSRSYFENGQIKHKWRVGIFVTRGKEWDSAGHLVSKSKMVPPRSTGYIERSLELEYNSNGTLKSKEYTREYSSCYGGYVYSGYVKKYDSDGRLISKQKKKRTDRYMQPTGIQNSPSRRPVKNKELKNSVIGNWTLKEVHEDKKIKYAVPGSTVSDSTFQQATYSIRKRRIVCREYYDSKYTEKSRYRYKLMTDSVAEEDGKYSQCVYFSLGNKEESQDYYLFGLLKVVDQNTFHVYAWGPKWYVFKRKE